MIETLNELPKLRDSGFGRPHPRHGLKLLYWFANDCGDGNVMLSECDPAKGDFGFHLFENRYDHNEHKLLPDIDFPYYVVGNLNVKKYPKAEKLPKYVSEDQSPDLHNSNTDRIIVSLSKERQFHRVYVTQHHDRINYDPKATKRISRGLLMNIRRRSLEDFLKEMILSPQSTSPVSQDSDGIDTETENSDTTPLMNSETSMRKKSKTVPKKENNCCTIL